MGKKSLKTPTCAGQDRNSITLKSEKDIIFDLSTIGPSKKWGGVSSTGQRWAVYQGSALDVLRDMPSSTVHCVVTSPPYFWLRDYGVDGQFGMEESIDEYVTSLTETMSEVKRVLRSDGVAFFNIGDTFYSGKGKSHGQDEKSKKRRFGLRAVDKSGGMGIGLQRKSLIGIPWRIATSFMESGWIVRSAIIWHRMNRLPEYVLDRPGRSYEYVFLLAQARKYYFNKQALVDGKIEEDMWTIPAQPKTTGGLDTAPFPDELVQRCLDVGCPEDGIVLDPFLGSGTSIRVANMSGRSGVGIDLNKAFCEYAARTLSGGIKCS
ncbi:MAG: site-specific DNA-methyltransferase [Gammaproteobacteria bacterium]|nr:site-specific DNA-methyltransferase [Gammaproteobacteria bacterium]